MGLSRLTKYMLTAALNDIIIVVALLTTVPFSAYHPPRWSIRVLSDGPCYHDIS